jgi:hypothetical protein
MQASIGGAISHTEFFGRTAAIALKLAGIT